MSFFPSKFFRETFTRLIKTGAAKASPELSPNTPTDTAIASSKIFDAAVKLNVADCW